MGGKQQDHYGRPKKPAKAVRRQVVGDTYIISYSDKRSEDAATKPIVIWDFCTVIRFKLISIFFTYWPSDNHSQV